MTGKIALLTLIALCSIAVGKPVLSSTAVMGEISISGAKKVLLPITSATGVKVRYLAISAFVPTNAQKGAVKKAPLFNPV